LYYINVKNFLMAASGNWRSVGLRRRGHGEALVWKLMPAIKVELGGSCLCDLKSIDRSG
jgi:hypothetical protein